MPAYGSLGSPVAAYPGDTVVVFNAESLSTNGASIAVVPSGPYEQRSQADISVEVSFSGAPGAFEIDIQSADTDTANAYIVEPTVGTITTVNTGNYARVELPVRARFVRLFVKAQPANVVTCTAKITR